MLDETRTRIQRRLIEIRRYRPVTVIWRAGDDFMRHQGGVYAAAMSYHVLLSLVPLLILLAAVFGLVAGSPKTGPQLIGAILEQVPEGAGRQQVWEVTAVSADNTGWLGLVGLLTAAWTASGMFGALRRALNNAFDVPMARPFIYGRAQDMAGVFGIVALGILSIALTAALGIVRAFADQFFIGFLVNLGWGLATLLFPLAVSFIVFLLVYRLVPNHTLGVRDLWGGALVSAFGFELAKIGFGLYLANFGRYQQTYGALGGIVAFLVFVYLVSNIAIFGAELATELARERAGLGHTTRDAGGARTVAR